MQCEDRYRWKQAAIVLSLFVCCSGVAGAIAAAPPQSSAAVDYERDIRPLFAHKCNSCHGALKQEAGLRLDAGRLIVAGGDGGSVLERGDASASLILERVAADDPLDRMPPEGEGEPLSAAQVTLLRNWINAGAPYPEAESIPVGPDRHWAFQPLVRPQIPTTSGLERSHPIDAFIARGYRSRGLQPVDVADRVTLFRRLYFDLIGLPPTPAEILDFTSSDSWPEWKDTVNALLENPHYGERWGRHWMDVWRYSDWDGYKQQLRGSQRHIWHWRDWIVDSLNADKGYDQMITEMLAADEIAADDPAALAATGFLARNYHNSNRDIWLDATVEHTAKAFLGLTISCARCHDHKYDPIPQQAYYEFRAIFEPHRVRTDRVPGELDRMRDGIPRVYDADLAAETFVYLQGNEKQPDKENPLQPQIPAVVGGEFEVAPISLPLAAARPALRSFVEEDHLQAAREELAAANLAWINRSAEADEQELLKQRDLAQLALHSLRSRFAADRARSQSPESEETRRRARLASQLERELKLRKAELAVYQAEKTLTAAEQKKQTEKGRSAALASAQKQLAEARKQYAAADEARRAAPGDEYTEIAKSYPAKSTGRRTALARWLTDPANPLTARVAANHIWMRHFGRPLVDNVDDFGLRTPRPQHADLLDWLAVELIEHDWSMKHLHRLILTSRTWRLRSTAEGPAAERNRGKDPDNLFFWRHTPRRLDAEIVRDNVLAVSESLDRTFGGPDIDFRKGETSRRRSIYLRHAYEKQMTMLVIFDAPSPNECYRRTQSVVPQQALAMTNSSFTLGKSRQLARLLWNRVTQNEQNAEDAFVAAAYLQILGRCPSSQEQSACIAFLSDQAALLSGQEQLTTFVGGGEPQVHPAADPRERARENLIQVLLNHNDFFVVR